MANDTDTDWLRKRLDAILLLLIESSAGGADTTTQKIERLNAFGFSNSEIGQMLGKKPNYVGAVLSAKKKKASKKSAS